MTSETLLKVCVYGTSFSFKNTATTLDIGSPPPLPLQKTTSQFQGYRMSLPSTGTRNKTPLIILSFKDKANLNKRYVCFLLTQSTWLFNPLNTVCHLLAFVAAHHILHVSRTTVKLGRVLVRLYSVGSGWMIMQHWQYVTDRADQKYWEKKICPTATLS